MLEILNTQRISDKRTGIVEKINNHYLNAEEMVDIVLTAQIVPSACDKPKVRGIRTLAFDLRKMRDQKQKVSREMFEEKKAINITRGVNDNRILFDLRKTLEIPLVV